MSNGLNKIFLHERIPPYLAFLHGNPVSDIYGRIEWRNMSLNGEIPPCLAIYDGIPQCLFCHTL